MPKIVVIGSGLSSLAAVKILIDKGIKPLVLDRNLSLDKNLQSLKNKISKQNKSEWKKQDIEKLTFNNTLNNRYPKKFYMGSDFFYFKKNKFLSLDMKNDKNYFLPSASHAKNGLSSSWGSAVLPLSHLEQNNFPFNINDLNKYYNLAIQDLDYVAEKDNLSLHFDILKNKTTYHHPDKDINLLLKKFAVKSRYGEFIAGKSRLLANLDKYNGCKKCGHCMSGCFYDYIYKPEKDFINLVENKKIDFLPDVLVDTFEEKNNKIQVNYFDKNNNKNSLNCDKLIIAAGAINSTIIHAKSYKLHNYKFKLLQKNGTVIPIFNINHQSDDWPERHTLPLIFLTLFNQNKLEMFSQISKPNELIIKKLYGSWKKHSILSKFFCKNFIITHNNLSSEFSDSFELKVNQKDQNEHTKVEITKIINDKRLIKEMELINKLVKYLNLVNLYPIKLMAKNTDSQHNGGTMPMVKKPIFPNETFENGTTKFSKNIFYVDSAVLTTLPATPIALPMMANAMRIVDKINLL